MPKLATDTATRPIHVIEPYGVYFVDDIPRLFRVRGSTVRRERRQGRLKVAKRAGRYFILGKWLVEWIEGGLPGKGGGS